MRSMGNYYSEWADARGNTRRTLLATLVACAVGATASAAVIFSLASSSTTQSGVPPISPRAIVRNVGAIEVPNGPQVEPTRSPQATVRNTGAFEAPKAVQNKPVEPTSQPAANGMVSARDEPVTQTEAEHRAGVHSQQPRRHSRVRYPYWRRFAHNPWPKPFGSW